MLANARALAARLQWHGFDLVGGGTDTPLMLVDLRRQELQGKPAALSLERAGIIANANPTPSDRSDLAVMSGLRFGVSAATTRGFGTPEFGQIGDWIAQVLSELGHGGNSEAVERSVLQQVNATTRNFPVYGSVNARASD